MRAQKAHCFSLLRHTTKQDYQPYLLLNKELLPMQPGDVYQTFADVSDLEKDFGFKPATTLEQGLSAFAKWYKGYRKYIYTNLVP